MNNAWMVSEIQRRTDYVTMKGNLSVLIVGFKQL